MKLGHTNDEIKYVETVDNVARFMLVLDGIDTMKILCDTTDDEKTIVIARADGTHQQATKGRFAMKTKLTEDSDGLPLGAEVRVDRLSVYRYVLPRLHVLLGRLLRAA